MQITVYLAGHIHGAWREELRSAAATRGLPLTFVGPREAHDRSDSVGEDVLGRQPEGTYRDQAGAAVNNLRTRILLAKADVVVALFGQEFRQWNTAMDASAAIQSGKPVIVVRPPNLHHALKELADRAQVVVETTEQALDVLAYIFEA